METSDLNNLQKRIEGNSNKNLFGETELEAKASNPTEKDNLKIYERLRMLVGEGKAIYIPHHVPALKNSKRIFQFNTGKSACCKAAYTKLEGKRNYKCNACGNKCQLGTRPIIKPSQAVEDYMAASSGNIASKKPFFDNLIKEYGLPIHVGFYFVRKTKQKFDLDNAITTLLDQMKNLGLIPEDDSKVIYPYPLGEHHHANVGGAIIVPMERPLFKFINDTNLPI